MVFLWAMLGAAIAVGLEFYFKRGGLFLPALWWILPCNLVLTYSIARLLQSGGAWLPLITLFGLATLTARTLLASFVLHEPMTGSVVVSIGALLVSAVVREIWR